MGKTIIFIILIFLVVLGFFALENKEVVTLKVPFGAVYEMPKVALLLLSTAAGALIVLFIFFIRDTKRVIDNLQYQKKQKLEAKIHSYYSKALNAILGNKEDEAKEALTEILKEDPEHIDALLRQGDMAASDGDYKKAYEYYKKAKEINPRNVETIFSLETIMEKMQRHDDALKYLDEILDIDPENLTALYRKRSIFEKKEMYDELLDVQKSILKLQHHEAEKKQEDKRFSGYKYEYARLSLERGELEKAEKMFRTILKSDNNFIPAHLGLAEALLSRGETEEAINLLEKGFKDLNSIIILARLEDLLIIAGEPARLIRFYNNAISKNPNDQKLKFLLGKVYYRLEMVDDAIEMLNSIDTGVFSAPELFSIKGELFAKRNQIASALNEFRKACDLKRSLRLPYCCSNCGYKSDDWAGRCPQCMEWNTYRLDI